ncbi:hypothetical protein Tco_0059474 [Tanacetum coccineum]
MVRLDMKTIHDLGSVENEFPAIVFNNMLTSEAALLCEPTVSSLNNDEIDFRISVPATPLSTAFFSTSIIQDFQDSPDDEEDTRINQEYMNDVEEEYQARALLAKYKMFFKKEEVSSNDNEVTEVKALMALADEERIFVSKEIARNGEWIKISIKKHVNTEILKENQNLRNELKELTFITEAWLNSSNKVNQCISEQIPTQKKKILGIDQLTEDTSSSRPKDLVFVKSSSNNLEVSITSSNKPKLSKAEDSTLSNYDIDEHPLPLLEKLTGAELVSGPKTTKSILKSKSTFKAENLKGIIINKHFSAPARGNKGSSAFKTNSAPVGIKSRNPQHVTKNCETRGSNVHTTSDHNDIEWFRKRESLQAKKVKSFKASKTKSSSAPRSNTPTKSEYSNCAPNMLGPDLNGKAVNESQYREKALQMLVSFLKAILFAEIKDHTLKRDFEFHFIPTQYQLADIFTKLLNEPNFKRFIVELVMLNIDSKPEASILTEEN